MPHVVLNGKVNIEDVFAKMNPLLIRNGEHILKTANMYIEREKKSILIDSLVIEASKKINFFAMVSGREDGIVIRIYPRFEVEKTNGVKRTLAEIAKQLLQLFPELKVGQTNLTEFLQ